MKILWISNHPDAPSGYGGQTRQVGRRIGELHDIEFVANDGSRPGLWRGHKVRGSSGKDMYSRDKVAEDLRRSEADWVISLYDVWVYTAGRKDPFDGIERVAAWLPVDHFPVPIVLYPWLRNGHTAIAMSRFGQEWLTRLSDAWGDKHRFPVLYAPHAVEDTFVRVESDFRQSLGIPADAYLVGIVAANNDTLSYDRKGLSDMAHALGIFMDRHPDTWLYVHSTTEGDGRMDLESLFQFKGIPGERLRVADQYRLSERDYGDGDMAAAYSAFDVLLATSRGEGFGIPVIEAQATGTPVIVSNWTAQPELVGDVFNVERPESYRAPSGWVCSVIPDYDPRQGGDFGKPFLPAVIAALDEAYGRRGDAALRDAAIAKAAEYRADAVFERHWRPILAAMEEATKPAPMPNRAERRALARVR